MKPLLSVLALAVLAACGNSSTIDRTGERVTYAGKSYPIYVEHVHTQQGLDGKEYRYDRRMIYVRSRYIWCEPDCAAALDVIAAPDL